MRWAQCSSSAYQTGNWLLSPLIRIMSPLSTSWYLPFVLRRPKSEKGSSPSPRDSDTAWARSHSSKGCDGNSLCSFVRCTGLLLESWGSLRELSLCCKMPFKTFFLFHTSHRAFVELVTYCMPVPRARKRDRQPLSLALGSLRATLQSTHLSKSGQTRLCQTYISIFLKQQTGAPVLAFRKLCLTYT